eukprot:233458_1
MEEVITANVATEKSNAKGPPKTEYSGCCAPWKWFAQKPTKRWRFLIFFICGCLTILWLIMFIATPQNPQPYVYGGIICFIMCMWALNHFRILTKLTEQVDRLHRLNADFNEENKQLRTDVLTLAKTEKHLSGIKDQIKELNVKLQANIAKFQQLDKNLRTISDSNIAGIERIQSKSKLVVSTMTTSLIRHEKQILHAVYDDLEFTNNMSGLSREQFDTFWTRLPKSYFKRWKKLGKTFDGIAGVNGILDYKEFAAMADDFAKQEAMVKLHGGST